MNWISILVPVLIEALKAAPNLVDAIEVFWGQIHGVMPTLAADHHDAMIAAIAKARQAN